MKTRNARKLTLHRESLRLLDDAAARTVGGAIPPPTTECAYTLQVVACYSQRVPSCVCTVD
ncbi:MAG: hypothetical protein DMF53_12090 [Acidobacteria bacterium]|nr:MAG: hypothetical protein DMF53_12090 [Acidobacteriota bacterium]